MDIKTQKNDIQTLLENPATKARIESVLQSKSQQFTVSLLALANSHDKLKECEPRSVFIAALTAASLDLPINQSLGHAYIIPYKDKEKGMMAQFQLGYKGLIQLAIRSGQFKTINATDIREGEILNHDIKSGEFELAKIEDRESKPIVGYLAFFSLLNGFEKTLFMTVGELKKHGLKYSKSFANGYGVWKDDIDVMAKKTVIKLLLSRFAPMSIEMTRAVISDQAILKDLDEPEYIDNKPEKENNVKITCLQAIQDAKTIKELEFTKKDAEKNELIEEYTQKLSELSEKEL